MGKLCPARLRCCFLFLINEPWGWALIIGGLHSSASQGALIAGCWIQCGFSAIFSLVSTWSELIARPTLSGSLRQGAAEVWAGRAFTDYSASDSQSVSSLTANQVTCTATQTCCCFSQRSSSRTANISRTFQPRTVCLMTSPALFHFLCSSSLQMLPLPGSLEVSEMTDVMKQDT